MASDQTTGDRHDTDRICITCGKPGGACRWSDDAETCMRGQLQTMRSSHEAVAKALWRLDNPIADGFSEVAPNDWDKWPEDGRAASLAHVDHSKDDYRERARVAIEAISNGQ